MTPHPHDALIKLAFESPADAAGLFMAILPPALRDAIAWKTLKCQPGSFVDPALHDRHNDLLFSVHIGTPVRHVLYLLLEHQSTRDSGMPLRILSYDSRVWDRFRKQRRSDFLPPIVAVVLSHVPRGWSASRDFASMFDRRVLATIGLAPLVPQFSLIIEDLTRRSNEDIQAWSMGRLQGHEEGRRDMLVTAVRTLVIGKFHTLDARDERRLRAATAEALDRYLQRVLSASTPAEVFGD